MSNMRLLGVLAWGVLLSFVEANAHTSKDDSAAWRGKRRTADHWRAGRGVAHADDNRNATVTLAWGRTGGLTWRDGLPLL